MKRQLAEQRGRKGERFASLWMLLQGWRTVAKRVKTPRGEIDLIVRRGDTVAFIEVKWRAKPADLDHAIDEYRLRRVAAAVEAVAHEYAEPHETIRIDVMLLAPGHRPRHIINAWQP
ncbi:YraN family protein [Altererythrobacter sp. ZODW24]|uniref:YraN family protein n=1 Tax=Altererythrobacter sp. ZODW24 TaxID=2185142 RepID=UPI000DF80A95|nr:YraN family protein [Altererythrobacter sp. ZODW24]